MLNGVQCTMNSVQCLTSGIFSLQWSCSLLLMKWVFCLMLVVMKSHHSLHTAAVQERLASSRCMRMLISTSCRLPLSMRRVMGSASISNWHYRHHARLEYDISWLISNLILIFKDLNWPSLLWLSNMRLSFFFARFTYHLQTCLLS